MTSEVSNGSKSPVKMEVDLATGSDGSTCGSNSDNAAALTVWEQANDVEELGDEFLKFNAEVHHSIINAHPWTKDPHYFKSIKISAVALLKMLIHAQSGHEKEIMGMLVGKVAHETIIVMDTFPLMVEGTEVRVNPQEQAYEFIVQQVESMERVGRREKVLGWYHSHPGYGCWLSGIDVSTQSSNQRYQEPFVAVVVDHIRTLSFGKVHVGAFRTYPEGYKPPDEGPQEYQSIPMEKIEDFGVHCKSYYSLEVSFFKSSLEKNLINMLWYKYWLNSLSADAASAQERHLNKLTTDLAKKVENAASSVDRASYDHSALQEKLAQCAKDAAKLSYKQINAMIGSLIKDDIFKVY
ncbi:unnamed protein product [Hymenolepis diminuta]|uniref:MPN domain-containing protein n=1 Tax=Hymenolepis diminuta TaxID=6216 RepID=A0A0R3SGC1_HYMDI|nr:unnamed protein product [Hymenolepis diminuta]VUZ45772.1 unnamed protein product [Hymenolepis diminuta]